MKKILIIHGHPDKDRNRFGYRLAHAYKESSERVGNEVREIFVADLDFPILRSKEDYIHGELAQVIVEQQRLIMWADHIAIFFPLWLGGMPALLKGFLEQTLRPTFVFEKDETGKSVPKLRGKSARIIITMGMPAFVYRWFFLAHSLKSLQRNILKFCGIHPIKTTLVGLVEADNQRRRKDWIGHMHRLARKQK